MAIHQFVFHNGRVCPSDAASLHPGQLGLLAGWGVFSTLRVEDGVLFAWERHWARMSRDAAVMGVPMPDDSESLRQGLYRLIEANHAFHATLRLVVIRNGGGMWEDRHPREAVDVVAMTAERSNWGSSARLMYQPDARHSANEFAGAKINSWAQNLCWYERAHQRGFDECILLNEKGEVTECTSANIFLVEGANVWTPPLSSGLLPGVTRDIVLHELDTPGVSPGERVIRPGDLEGADDVFITSTTRDLMPVSWIGEKSLVMKGEVRSRLQQAFAQYLLRYTGDQRAATLAGSRH